MTFNTVHLAFINDTQYSPMNIMIDWLIDWLIDWCFTARQRKIGHFVPIYQGGLLAKAFKDSQRGTYKNIYYDTQHSSTHIDKWQTPQFYASWAWR